MESLDYHNHHQHNNNDFTNGGNRMYSPAGDEESNDEDSSNGSRQKTSNKKLPPAPGTNTGRWTNEEHQRFLSGLEQFGTGSWKKITELVGTRSCTQVRTHAQKYFLALQKPPLPDGATASSSVSKPKKTKESRKKSRLLGEADDDKRSKKKFKYAKGVAAGAADPWLYGANGNGVKRGLSGMSLLAQAAMVDPEFEKMDQTVEEYEKRHGRPKDDDSSDDDGSNDDDDDDEEAPDDVSVDVVDEGKQQKPSSSSSRRDVAAKQSSSESKQEILKLRDQLQLANQALQQMRQEVHLAEARAIEAIEGRNIAINECRELQEMNNQLKAEHRRIVMALDKPNQYGGATPSQIGSGGNGGGNSNPTPQSALSAASLEHQMQGLFPSMAAAAQSQHLQHQDQIVIEVLQSRLKEAELRYHQVTESLARQTGVLTDQHRAVLELNSKLENEMARRRALELEVERLKRHGAK